MNATTSFHSSRIDSMHHHSQPAIQVWFRFVLAVATAMTSACAVGREAIEGADNSVVFVGGRMSFDLSKRPVDPPASGARITLDVDASFAEAEFTQDVATGESIQLDQVIFAGPTELDVDVNVARLSFAARIEARSQSGLGIGGFAGVGVDDLHLEIEDRTNAVDDDDSLLAIGPLVGATFYYEPVLALRLYLEASAHPSFGSSIESADVNSLEAGARVRFDEHWALLVAWRKLAIDVERDDLHSDLELELSGPVAVFAATW